MKNNQIFKNFKSVSEFEILEPAQMNSLEAGAACESGCKKACMGGGQNYSRRVGIIAVENEPVSVEDVEYL